MTSGIARVVFAVGMVVASVVSVSGCALNSSPISTSVVSYSDILTEQLPSDVTAQGVLLAAILLRSGDVEKALSNGTITPAEVDRARRAIDEKQLDLWRQRAENE